MGDLSHRFNETGRKRSRSAWPDKANLSKDGKKVMQHKGRQRRGPIAPQHDEEIDSDEEEKAQGRGKELELQQARTSAKIIDTSPPGDEDDDFFETPEEKRIRLAKQFLEHVGMGTKTDAEVAKRLTEEANIASKKVQYNVADTTQIGQSQFFKGHKDTATCLCTSEHDKMHVYTGGKDCAIIQWDISTGQKVIFPGKKKDFDGAGHFEHVLDVSVSDDGKTLVSVGNDRLVRLWDIRCGNKPIDAIKGHTKSITAVCSEPNSDLKQFFTTGADLSLRVWNFGSRACVETFYGHTASPTCMDILVKDRPITGGEDNVVRWWKISNESHLLYPYHTQPVDAVCQINGTKSIAGSQDGSLSLWNTSSRKPIVTIDKAHHGNWITSLGCIRYGDLVFSGSDDGFIRLWKLGTKKPGGLRDLERKERKSLVPSLEQLQSKSIPIVGVVNQIATSNDGLLLFAAIGKEHRHGRWKTIKTAKNGLLIVPLQSSQSVMTEI